MSDHELFDPSDAFGNGDDKTPVALVSTIETYAVRVSQIEDDRIPEGMVCMGSFIGERLIARSAVPPEVIEDVVGRDAFEGPIRLALTAVEEEPGLQCRLFALLPAEQFQDPEDEPDEPWKASVPRFEEQLEDADEADDESPEGEAVVPLLLGHVVRFARDRKHPEDLAQEAADVLQTLLASDTPLASVVDRVLEELLNQDPDDQTGPNLADEK